MESRSLRSLVGGLIDYAGLFPPAKLAMQPAAEAYFRALGGPHEWMLSRFVCPATRLAELSAAASMLMPGTNATSGYREFAAAGEPWRISALVEKPEELDLIDRFNEQHSREDQGLANVDVLEFKVDGVEAVDRILDAIAEDVFPFFEVPAPEKLPGGDARGFVAALAGNSCGAKIRTGGILESAFPATQYVAEFMVACRQAEVPFKATAGLHHPVRGSYPLTYEKGAASCTMHGFLNVFVAGCFVFCKAFDAKTAEQVLNESDPKAFICTDQGLTWRNHVLDITEIARAREAFALSVGSCSFDEPVEDLKKLGLL
ncbi:MAG: hypothetical protein U0573_15275 [Phycisphaerales bacterium]|nr:hypothetical protein [Planctomycetota bacterium]